MRESANRLLQLQAHLHVRITQAVECIAQRLGFVGVGHILPLRDAKPCIVGRDDSSFCGDSSVAALPGSQTEPFAHYAAEY